LKEKEYSIEIPSKKISEVISWCNENNFSWYSKEGKFYFSSEQEVMAVKLKFIDKKTKHLIIDPPSGWQYGFPKIYNKQKNQTIEDWLLQNGYPQELINQGMVKYCRFWEHEDLE